MKTSDSFDRRLSEWLGADAQGRVANHLAEVLVTTRATRQRSGWSSLERWLTVDFASGASPLALRSVRLALIGLLILVIAAVAILAAGATKPLGIVAKPSASTAQPSAFTAQPIAPTNGSIVYATDGDIVAFDPSTRRTSTIVGGPEIDRSPRVSPDGTKVIFVRELADSSVQLMVVGIDGTSMRARGVPLDAVDNVAWSPDGTQVAMDSDIDGEVAIRIDDGRETSVIARHDAGSRIAAVNDLQWLPENRGLVFRGWDAAQGLFGIWTVRFDGTNLRQVLPGDGDRRELVSVAVSPNGQTIAYAFVDEARIRLVDLATGAGQALAFDGADAAGGDRDAVWSPDGSRLAFLRSGSLNSARVMVGSSAGGAVIETEPAFSASSPPRITFSPDGAKVLVFSAASSAVWILDVGGEKGEPLPFTADEMPSWQGLAP